MVSLPACSVPLAPGYAVLEEKREVKFVPGAAPEVDVRADYVLQNTGTAPLDFIEVKLPPAKSYGRQDSRAEIGGREAAIQELPEEYRPSSPDVWRIALDAPWSRKEKRKLTIQYALRDPADPGWRLTIGASDFHLGSRGWAPILQPPRHALSPTPKRPPKSSYTVRVPAGYQVEARGILKKKNAGASEWVYTFQLEKGNLAPFVVAGKYLQTPPDNPDVASFWTASPPAGDLQAAQSDLQQAWNTMKTEFGPSDRDAAAPLIVESASLRDRGDAGGVASAGFPGGALVSPDLLAKGISSADFLDAATLALAHDWFGDGIFPPPFAAISMGDGLPAYATIVMAEARDGEAGRRRRVADYLARYDAACRAAEEIPLGVVRDSDTREARRIARAKAPLFYVALEDEYGEKPVRAGLRQMATLLRGQEAGVDVMRASLEQTTGKDLAPVFRLWLYQKGIPTDFRARYATTPEQHTAAAAPEISVKTNGGSK